MNEMANRIIAERKNAIDLLLVVFPASICANLIANFLSASRCCWFEILIALLMVFIFLYRYINTLKGEISECIFVKKIVLDKKRNKIHEDNGGGSFALGLPRIFEEFFKKEPDLVKKMLNDESADIWSLALDLYEITIFCSVAFNHMGGWKTIQMSRNVSAPENKGGFTKFSFEDLPSEIKEKNLIFKYLPEKFKQIPNVSLFMTDFYFPPSSEIKYSRSDGPEGDRRIVFDNKMGRVQITMSKSFSGYQDWGVSKEPSLIYFNPIFHFMFESKSMWALGDKYVDYLLWVERLFGLVKRVLG